MSAGTPPVSVRIPSRVLARVRDYLERREALACVSSWTLSDFLVVACIEKLDKLDRSGKKARRVLEQTEIDDYMCGNLAVEGMKEVQSTEEEKS